MFTANLKSCKFNQRGLWLDLGHFLFSDIKNSTFSGVFWVILTHVNTKDRLPLKLVDKKKSKAFTVTVCVMGRAIPASVRCCPRSAAVSGWWQWLGYFCVEQLCCSDQWQRTCVPQRRTRRVLNSQPNWTTALPWLCSLYRVCVVKHGGLLPVKHRFKWFWSLDISTQSPHIVF